LVYSTHALCIWPTSMLWPSLLKSWKNTKTKWVFKLRLNTALWLKFSDLVELLHNQSG
jgi:hypothetical protein